MEVGVLFGCLNEFMDVIEFLQKFIVSVCRNTALHLQQKLSKWVLERPRKSHSLLDALLTG